MSLYPAQYTDVETIEELREKVDLMKGDSLSYENIKDDNDLRAAWGGVAFLAFKDKTMPSSDEDFDTVMGDLLADLMHLCDALGLDWDEMCDKGRRHYVEELNGIS